jgi:hypothetical protein
MRAGLLQLQDGTLDYSSVDDAVLGRCVTPQGRVGANA